MSGTSPDSVIQPSRDYGVLGPYEPNVISVLEYGADPTGNNDNSLIFQTAVDAFTADGGVLYVPSGSYRFTYGVALPSNVTVRGAGPSSTAIVATADYLGATMGNAYSFFYNENWDATDITDTDICVEGIKFDYSWRTTGNAMHPLKFRKVRRLTIRDNYFYYGGNSIAVRGCDVVWVENNFAYEFRNCAWDFWEGPGITTVRGNYAESSETAQMLNFNPEFSPVASSPLDVLARYLIVANNTFKATGENSEPCQIEPLGNRDNGVFNVVIADNTFLRTYLVLRGRTERVTITGNVFDDYPAENTNVIRLTALNGYTPKSVIIANNVINEPGTTSGQFGVIRCQADNAVVTGNVITGTAYTDTPFYSGTYSPNQYGNFFEKLGVTGRMRQGFIFTNHNDGTNDQRSCIGWEDTSGNALRMFMNGNFHQFWSTAADGAGRQVWSITADSDTSDLNVLIPGLFSDHLRIGADSGLTAAGTTYSGALQLTKNFNVVTTVAAASGVRLPLQGTQNITGWEVTVWNLGAEMLSVYPASNGYIADYNQGVHDLIAPGMGRVYVAYDSTHWTIKAEQTVTLDLAGDDISAQDSGSSVVDLTTAPATEPPTHNINHVLLYGQSLATGAEGLPGLSTVAKYENLQFGTAVTATNNTVPSDVWTPNGSAVPTDLAVTGTTFPEVPLYGGLNTYRALTFRSHGITTNTSQKMIASGCGIGGTAIAALQQGAVPNIFNRLVSCMDQVHTYCTGQALTYGVTAMVWLQGESNSTTSQATYATALRDIYADFCVAALAESGQTDNPAMFMYQTTARNGNYNTAGLGVQMAQLDIALNDAGCFMVGPIYPYNDSGNLHLPANSYRWWGSQLGKVMHRVLTLGQEWKPLYITAAEMRGRRVLVTYYVPHGPLVFDDPWLQTGWTPSDPTTGAANTPFAATDRGFTIRDSASGAGSTLDIASVALVSDNQILITLDSVPPAATYYLYYADGSTGHYGHGSVRDSDPALADDIYQDLVSGQGADERQYNVSGQRYPLYNWAVSQLVTIAAV